MTTLNDLRQLDETGMTDAELIEVCVRAGIDLQGADLWHADLQGANLQGANLQGADLWRANLQGADLWRADLQGVDLQGANLRGANLQGADLQGVDLQGVDLQGANLRGAGLQGADLQEAVINWQSHELVAELLRQAAIEAIHYAVAGYVLMRRNYCWRDFLNDNPFDDATVQWALDTLSAFVKHGDNAPEFIK